MSIEKICDTCAWSKTRDEDGDPICHNENAKDMYEYSHYKGAFCNLWQETNRSDLLN